MKKKVLVLAYDFPPYQSVAALRPASWLKYLPENNIHVTVVTRHWDENVQSPIDYIRPSTKRIPETTILSEKSRVIRVPFTPNWRDRLVLKYGMNRFVLLRKILSGILTIGRFFSPIFDETYPIFLAANQLLRVERFDWIIATGEPFILFKHAALLSKKHHVPWIADYRDCWTNSPQKDMSSSLEKIALNCLQRIERKIVSSASFLITASPSYKDRLLQLHRNKTIHVIFNGSDFQADTKNIKPNTHCFEIAYAGIFYEHQQLEMFLDGYYQFIQAHAGVNTQAVFYGIDFYPDMKKRLIDYKKELQPYLRTTPRMPYQEVMKLLQRAHMFLLLTNEGANWLNAKIFDYLSLKRPILLVKNDKGILEKILDETQAGFKASSAEEVKQHLETIYSEQFQKGKSLIPAIHIELYTRKQQTAILAALLKETNQ